MAMHRNHRYRTAYCTKQTFQIIASVRRRHSQLHSLFKHSSHCRNHRRCSIHRDRYIHQLIIATVRRRTFTAASAMQYSLVQMQTCKHSPASAIIVAAAFVGTNAFAVTLLHGEYNHCSIGEDRTMCT